VSGGGLEPLIFHLLENVLVNRFPHFSIPHGGFMRHLAGLFITGFFFPVTNHETDTCKNGSHVIGVKGDRHFFSVHNVTSFLFCGVSLAVIALYHAKTKLSSIVPCNLPFAQKTLYHAVKIAHGTMPENML
jgi:hypothetical protein